MRRIHNFKQFNEKQMELFGTAPHHAQIQDAFSDLNVMDYNKYKSSVTDLQELIDENIEKALKRLGETEYDLQDYYNDFAYRFDHTSEGIWTDEFLKAVDDEIENGAVGDWYYVTGQMINDGEWDMDDALTEEGKKEWTDFLREKFNEETSEMINTVTDSFDEEGLIKIWRAVKFSKETDMGDFDDVYDAIVKGYGSAGVYWSWNEGAAEAHWGSSSGDARQFVLHGQIRPEDVDWEETLYKNAYTLREEHEIRTKDNTNVRIDGMSTMHDGKERYIEFDEPFIIKTSKGNTGPDRE